MTALKRVRMAAVMLGIALAIQAVLLAHLMLAPANRYAPLRKPFANLPKVVAVERVGQSPMVWTTDVSRYQDKVSSDLPYKPADYAFREIYSNELKAAAEWSIIHAENGEDRKHHPEVCIRDVLKLPELEGERAVINLGDAKDPRPVQRFCFQQGEGRLTTVYYWYYTFAPEENGERTWLQSLYHSFSGLPPSVTVQVTTWANKEQRKEIEGDMSKSIGLLRKLDGQLRSEFLPPGVRMGCDRLPIGLVTK